MGGMHVERGMPKAKVIEMVPREGLEPPALSLQGSRSAIGATVASGKYGAGCRDRTRDLIVTNDALYQLS